MSLLQTQPKLGAIAAKFSEADRHLRSDWNLFGKNTVLARHSELAGNIGPCLADRRQDIFAQDRPWMCRRTSGAPRSDLLLVVCGHSIFLLALQGCMSMILLEIDAKRIASLRGERGTWQPRFWEHLIRDDEDNGRHIEYCYINPVKHGLVTRVRDWPFSSFHRDVAAGRFPQDQAGELETLGEFGEPPAAL
jgi:hypothetical protein